MKPAPSTHRFNKEVKMRELTLSEAEQVGGGESWGHFLANIQGL